MMEYKGYLGTVEERIMKKRAFFSSISIILTAALFIACINPADPVTPPPAFAALQYKLGA
jgi:hypothetical protein